MVVALLIPLCYLAWYFLTPAPRRGANVQQLVDAQLRSCACSELSGIVDAEGAVTVSGLVSKPGEIEQVRRDVAAIDGVESGEYDIKVRIWPHCEVIALLKPYRERNLNQNMGLQVTPTTGHSDRFIEGERIIRSEEHTSELQSLMRISYAVFCLKKKKKHKSITKNNNKRHTD